MISIRKFKIVADLRVFEAAHVSRDHGRRQLKTLTERGEIEPLKTPTGRCLLSFEEAERLANAL